MIGARTPALGGPLGTGYTLQVRRAPSGGSFGADAAPGRSKRPWRHPPPRGRDGVAGVPPNRLDAGGSSRPVPSPGRRAAYRRDFPTRRCSRRHEEGVQRGAPRTRRQHRAQQTRGRPPTPGRCRRHFRAPTHAKLPWEGHAVSKEASCRRRGARGRSQVCERNHPRRLALNRLDTDPHPPATPKTSPSLSPPPPGPQDRSTTLAPCPGRARGRSQHYQYAHRAPQDPTPLMARHGRHQPTPPRPSPSVPPPCYSAPAHKHFLPHVEPGHARAGGPLPLARGRRRGGPVGAPTPVTSLSRLGWRPPGLPAFAACAIRGAVTGLRGRVASMRSWSTVSGLSARARLVSPAVGCGSGWRRLCHRPIEGAGRGGREWDPLAGASMGSSGWREDGGGRADGSSRLAMLRLQPFGLMRSRERCSGSPPPSRPPFRFAPFIVEVDGAAH